MSTRVWALAGVVVGAIPGGGVQIVNAWLTALAAIPRGPCGRSVASRTPTYSTLSTGGRSGYTVLPPEDGGPELRQKARFAW